MASTDEAVSVGGAWSIGFRTYADDTPRESDREDGHGRVWPSNPPRERDLSKTKATDRRSTNDGRRGRSARRWLAIVSAVAALLGAGTALTWLKAWATADQAPAEAQVEGAAAPRAPSGIDGAVTQPAQSNAEGANAATQSAMSHAPSSNQQAAELSERTGRVHARHLQPHHHRHRHHHHHRHHHAASRRSVVSKMASASRLDRQVPACGGQVGSAVA
jgi:hypothetical protein